MPQDWKNGHVTPIFKNRCQNTLGNYRTVSLISSVVVKVFESVIRDVMIEHLFDIRSTTWIYAHAWDLVWLKCYQWWKTGLMHLKMVPQLMFYYQKTFDSVPHRTRLLVKLWAHGIQGKLLNWIKSYLTDQKQWIIVNDS